MSISNDKNYVRAVETVYARVNGEPYSTREITA